MDASDRRDIAARLRCLIAGQHHDLTEAARRLGVEELSLRISIDDISPFPTLDVLSAFVRHYGVDPSFVITGRYDASTHRRALDGNNDVVKDVIRELSPSTEKTLSEPTEEPIRLHIA